MVPEYSIYTSRLRLALIDPQQATDLQRLVSNSPTLHRWIDWCQPDFTEEQAKDFLLATKVNWVKSEAYGFGVFTRSTNQLMGMVAINELYHTFNMASIGYWLADEYQNQGYGKEAVSALINFSFEQLKLTRLEIVCDPQNKPSQQLALSCGATFEALAENRYLYNRVPRQGAVYSVTPNSSS